MKTIFKPLIVTFIAVLLLTACKKEAHEAQSIQQNEISQETLSQIKALGFGTGSVQKVEDGYLVEGDIVLTKEHLESKPATEFLRVGDEEQYRTFNLVGGLPRTITVRVSAALPNNAAYVTALNAAIARYNLLNLRIKFARVTVGGNIVLNPAPAGAGYYASAGFPAGGNPYPQILVNNPVLGPCAAVTKTSVIAHELGHCIGMRHTDYMNRSFSCGGAAVNEGAGAMGAVWIPGTPVGADPNSWMLACIPCGANRPFNANDIAALNWLY
jgi:hypothetical protein